MQLSFCSFSFQEKSFIGCCHYYKNCFVIFLKVFLLKMLMCSGL